MIPDSDVQSLCEESARVAFLALNDKTNLEILKHAKTETHVKELCALLDLGRCAVDSRVDKLRAARLVRRERGSGKVYPGELYEATLALFDKMKKHVEDNPDLLFNYLLKK